MGDDDTLKKIRLSAFGRPMYLDKMGKPLSLLEWAGLIENLEYKIVGSTEIAPTTINPASRLSTVWLGIDHSFTPFGPPLLFETMRFSLQQKSRQFLPGFYHPSLDFPIDKNEVTDQMRWSTEEQARLGHDRILRLIQELEMT